MKKFRFRLQKVKDTKEKRVKQKVNELSNLLRKSKIARSELQELQDNLDRTQQEIFQRSIKGCSINELIGHQQYTEKINEDIVAQKAKIESVDGEIEQLQAKILKLDKEKKILEKIREKRFLQYMQEQNREEQKHLDEMFHITQEFRKLL